MEELTFPETHSEPETWLKRFHMPMESLLVYEGPLNEMWEH